MNLKEQKQYLKFLYKVIDIFGLQENQVCCSIEMDKISFMAFKTKEMLGKDQTFKFELKVNTTPTLAVFTRKVLNDKQYAWSSPTNYDSCVFSYSNEFGISFHDKDNICYEFNKSSHFNMSLDNNMLITFSQYRDLYNEFKKIKSNYSLLIYGY